MANGRPAVPKRKPIAQEDSTTFLSNPNPLQGAYSRAAKSGGISIQAGAGEKYTKTPPIGNPIKQLQDFFKKKKGK